MQLLGNIYVAWNHFAVKNGILGKANSLPNGHPLSGEI